MLIEIIVKVSWQVEISHYGHQEKTNINLFILLNPIQTFQWENASIPEKSEAKMYRKLQESKCFGSF